MLTLEQGPGIRLDSVNSIADYTGQWWVGHCKSRMEKAFADDCANHRTEGESTPIPYFLPMVTMDRMHGRARRRVRVPIFASYAFFCGDAETRYEALATNRLCQVIPVVNQRKHLAELLEIERAVESEMEIELYPFAVVGRRCRVREGPLQGTTGTVVEQKGKCRLILQVTMLGQGAGLEIDKAILEPAD